MSAKISRKIKRVQTGALPGVTVEECEGLMDEYLSAECEDTFHVLVHGDLSVNNLIIDENSEFKWYVQ